MPGLASKFTQTCRVASFLRSFLLVAGLGISSIGLAQPPARSVVLRYDQAVGLAAKWILERRFEPAQKMLDELRKARPNDPQVLFLEGQLAFAEGKYKKAVSIYRRLLSRNPRLTRVRLALARALFAAHDFIAARYHFEIALGQVMNRQARRNIYAYLRAIRGSTSWLRFSTEFGVDSNPNFATNAKTINILGTTFVLNPSARAKKSFGVDVQAEGRYAFGYEDRDFVHGVFEHRDYAGSYADFDVLELTLGRTWVVGQTLWSAEAGPVLANYQQKELDRGVTVRFTNARPLGKRFLSTSYVSATELNFPHYSYLNGQQYWGSTSMRYALSPTSGAWISVSLGRNLAHEAAYSYRAVEGTIGYAKELEVPFNVQAQLSVDRYMYDEPLPLFGLARNDQLAQLDFELTARKWHFHGFAPMLSVDWGRNDSTIPLYSYRRRFVGFGLTRRF